MKEFLFLFLILSFFSSCYSQKPVEKWSFDNNESPYLSDFQKQEIRHAKSDYKIKLVNGIKGNAIQPETDDNIIIANLISRNKIKSDFSFGFYFKGGNFTFTSYPSMLYRISFGYDYINIVYPVKNSNKPGQVQVPLKGVGITSYDYLSNGDWHHFLFIFKESGEIQIWIDGKTDPSFKIKLSNLGLFPPDISDGFRTTGLLDEIEVFNQVLPNNFIYRNYKNKHNVEKLSSRSSELIMVPQTVENFENKYYDTKEFAPGYPYYSKTALEQLKEFPSPRFSASRKMLRNFPWLDITYLHREVKDTSQRFGNINPDIAVKITEEMATRWNYFIELPVLRVDSNSAYKSYTSSKEVYSALIEYANNNPDIPVASVLIQPQLKGIHAGFDEMKGAFVLSQNLPDKYYLTDSNKRPIVYKNKKWLNPFTADEVFENDGKIAAFYINQLAKHLKRDIDIFNENGEWFGHKWEEGLLSKSPQVKDFMKRNNLNYHSFNGWMHHHFDSVYKTTILKNIPYKEAAFTFYNISAYNSDYWPDYKFRINSNSYFNGSPRSTPSFYPAKPENWRISAGALNGFGNIAFGRKEEIELGVKFFAPFVSAGWSLEESNIRPAQWLALLKSMVMLGADFFNVGYFNVTSGGGWPNGKGPNDPSGYIYQVSMPIYAQALGSHIIEFLEDGKLLNPNANSKNHVFRIKASQENHLVIVRKKGDDYLIYGSIQPNSNFVGNVPDEVITEIELNGKPFKFKIRRQGSMYIYSPGTNPKFIQLDGWHQKEHPYYWSDAYPLEAELADNLNFNSPEIITGNFKEDDFSNSFSYVRLKTGKQLSFKPDFNKSYTKVLLRLRSGTESVFKVQQGKQSSEIKISNKNWKIVELPFNISKSNAEPLILSVIKGEVEIDHFNFQ